MNERILSREDREGRFGDCRIRPGMASCQLGRRSCSQYEQLFIRIMESIHDAVGEIKKEHHRDPGKI